MGSTTNHSAEMGMIRGNKPHRVPKSSLRRPTGPAQGSSVAPADSNPVDPAETSAWCRTKTREVALEEEVLGDLNEDEIGNDHGHQSDEERHGQGSEPEEGVERRHGQDDADAHDRDGGDEERRSAR